MVINQIGDSVQDPETMFNRAGTPVRECFFCGADRRINILLMRIGYLSVDLPRRGFDIVNEVPAQRSDEMAADIVLEVVWDGEADWLNS